MAALTLNRLFYEKYIENDFYLKDISFNDEYLYIAKNDKIIKQVNFYAADDLAKLPIVAFKINDPIKFLETLEINNECEKTFVGALEENDNDLTRTTELSRMFLPIRFITIKDISTEEDDKEVMNFLETFNKLVNANGYLTTSASAMFKQMSSVISWSLEPNQLKPNNNAQLIIKEYVNSLNNGTNNNFIDSYNNTSGSRGTSKVRTNTKSPSIFDEEINMEKAGFFSFLAILYIVFNVIVSLVIIAIKK